MLDRSKMLWFGRPPTEDDLTETRNRGLTLEVVRAGISPDFRLARAAVFWATDQHFEVVAELLEANLVRAIDEGLYLQIVVANDGQLRDVERVIDQLLPLGAPRDQHRLRIHPLRHHEVPNAALLHVPGPAANDDLEILLPDGGSLDDKQQFLLRRAFSDCKSITLRLLLGGKSGALTFLVDATLSTTLAGPRPLPYFAKLGAPQKLRGELSSYEIYAENHIEWHLRPNFQSSRCIYGVEQGILVGSFVQSSRSLWEAALAGEGPQLIRTLFEETLAVWRREAKKWPPDSPGSVAHALEKFCDFSQVPLKRVEAAKVHGGTVHSPLSLWRKLLDLPNGYWLQASIHGDMHGENVRVRKQDAIVIDFAHTMTGPMCADLASLEVWLSFKVQLDAMFNQVQWRAQVERLYRPDMINARWGGTESETTGDWLGNCLQEIRRIASTSTRSPDEYKRVLAVYLLRHASFPPDEECSDEDECRRTYAYWLANRMITALTVTAPAQLEAV
jgi:hypothetical protein